VQSNQIIFTQMNDIVQLRRALVVRREATRHRLHDQISQRDTPLERLTLS
jgi:hypothetical protein